MGRPETTWTCDTRGDLTLPKAEVYALWALLTVTPTRDEETTQEALRLDEVLRDALEFKEVVQRVVSEEEAKVD